MSSRSLMDQVQRQELEILRQIQSIAEKRGLAYFLAYGTALGAVRHQKQIPWDWDMDLIVPTAGYSELVEALREGLTSQFTVTTPGVEHYSPLFARVHVKGAGQAFAHVDLFPLTRAPSRRAVRRLHARLNRAIRQVHSLKLLRLQDRPHYSRSQRRKVKPR